MDCSLPGSSVHELFQVRVLEWVAISFSRGSSRPREWTQVSRIAGSGFNLWATREPLVPNHFAVCLKLTQYCKSNILQLKHFLKFQIIRSHGTLGPQFPFVRCQLEMSWCASELRPCVVPKCHTSHHTLLSPQCWGVTGFTDEGCSFRRLFKKLINLF